MDFEKRELVKLETFSIKGWMDSMSDIFLFDYVYLGIIFLMMTLWGTLQIYYFKRGQKYYDELTTIGFSEHREYHMWTNYRLARDFIINGIFYAVGPQIIAKDFFVILSAYLRGVKIRSSTFKKYI